MQKKPTYKEFRREILTYYKQSGRQFPWRETTDPYAVLVSEIMLQQTQTERVRSYYERFLKKFPTIRSLAKGDLADVLTLWSGLGYNRRALSLKRLAEILNDKHQGIFPTTLLALKELPGIGPYTAGALLAFAFNKPSVIIETNIRAVYTHFFFHDSDSVTDVELLRHIEASLDPVNPRIWYYALMDYGVKLKKEVPGLNKKSAHYSKQSPFKGSKRELRGKILKLLTTSNSGSIERISKALALPSKELSVQVKSLVDEGFLQKKGRLITIAGNNK